MIEEPNSRDAKADMTPARKNFSGPALAPPDNDRAAARARKQTRASKPRVHADARPAHDRRAIDASSAHGPATPMRGATVPARAARTRLRGANPVRAASRRRGAISATDRGRARNRSVPC
ncbi:hypothetical protein AQ708_21100 [Burkholderia pseudomallei]|nr:hypothetical protein AQ709_30820 [Burkholderia pseudomallei]OMQ58975.1 hypothetical protein AQ708_21100 [Burkholderia pseudomallei]OMQ65037.1 hypothetical protein AQ711_07600 [Burkholderia pseudomallei]OMQ73398.1 hypothetical protein AQ712_28200 [Burkholderia pseudomallei]OMR16615.1 hypothetical protein AQ719_16800 [Burkholderia pseudomallei]